MERVKLSWHEQILRREHKFYTRVMRERAEINTHTSEQTKEKKNLLKDESNNMA